MAASTPAVWQPGTPDVVAIPGGTGLKGSTSLGDFLENALEHNPPTAVPHDNLIGQAEGQVLSLAAGADFVPFDDILADMIRLNDILLTRYTFGPQGHADTIAKATVLTVASPGLAHGTDDTPQLVSGPGHGGLTLGSADNAFLAPGGFVYTPDAAFTGDDIFTIRHTDGTAETARVTVTAPVANAPVANADVFQRAADPAHPSLQADRGHGVLANDVDPFGKHLTAHLVDGPDNGKVSLAGDGSFVYTPGKAGALVDHFTYYDDNGAVRSPVQTAWVVVTDQSGHPKITAAQDAYVVHADQPSSIPADHGVLANDSGGAGKLAAFARDLPDHGTVSLGPDGSFEYIPTKGFAGQDHFSYVAADGHGVPSVATVTMTVTHDYFVA